MAKRGKSSRANTPPARKAPPDQPSLSRTAFVVSVAVIGLCFLIQLGIAAVVYPSLPPGIPSGWTGSSEPYNTVPSWMVFAYFPVGQIVLAALAFFSHRGEGGRRAMYPGKAESLIALSLLFTALQASIFHLRATL